MTCVSKPGIRITLMPQLGDQLKTRVNQSKSGNALLLTFHEGYSTYTITVPMPYAIRFFAEGLATALETLDKSQDSQTKLDSKDGEKAEIQEHLRKSAQLYERFLVQHGR
ncbi:MAG: hypothetical protein ACXABD_21450 [Candidatus Thorarchaeota archaeon]